MLNRLKPPAKRRFAALGQPARPGRDPNAVRILVTPSGDPAGARHEVHLLDAQAVAQLGSWELELSTGAMLVSAEMRRIFGWSAQEEPDLGRICDMAHPDDRKKVEEWLARNAAMRPPAQGCFFRVVKPDGTIRMLFGRSALRAARKGARTRICGTMQDVTEQAASERAVGEVAHLYRDIFEHCAWGIFQTTADGRYLTANPALARIYGYESPTQLLSRLTNIGGQLYVDSSRRDEFVRLMKDKGFVTGFESEVYRRDGATIWITETCREVRTSTGRLLYYEGTVEDITERKRREIELRAAKETAEIANRAKSEFLATMSHELRTPLNAVMGFAEIIRGEALGPLGAPAYRDYAGEIHNGGKRLLGVINDILDFVKADSGSIALARDTADLADFAAALVGQYAEAAATCGIELAVEVTGPVPAWVDEGRLQQAAGKLLDNALKFTPRGGRVAVAAFLDETGEPIVAVRDTGIGMGPAALAQVGQPFYQADSRLDRRFEGAGLGLAICHRLARLHGGVLAVASEPGQGTVATIRLPATASGQLKVL